MKWQCRIPCCQKVWSLPDDYRCMKAGGGTVSDPLSGFKLTRTPAEPNDSGTLKDRKGRKRARILYMGTGKL